MWVVRVVVVVVVVLVGVKVNPHTGILCGS
jgi:hypothetical protein